MKTNKKVIVVGGGIGGLAAAAILVKHSFEVTLYEKNVTLGGRASYRKMKGGYTLDSGIHALRGAENGPAARVLEMVGKPIDFAVKNSDGVMPMIYHRRRLVDAPYTTINLIKYPLLNFVQKIRLIQIIRRASKSDPAKFDNTTVSDWLREMNSKILEDDRLVDHLRLFLSIAFYCEADLDQISAGDFIRFFQKYPYDVGYPKGGWSQIIDKLRVSIEEKGGKIVTGKAVDQVIIIPENREKKRVAGVIVEGKKEEADAVILNIPAKSILRLVSKEHIPMSFAEILETYQNTSGIVIDVIGIPTKLLRAGKYDTVVNLNPSAIFRISSKYDKGIVGTSSEKDILTAWMPIRSDILQAQDQIESKFAHLLHLIEQVYPGVLANSEFQRLLICQMVIGRYPITAPSHRKRLPIRFPEVDCMYFVGDAADADGIGGSSDAAFVSAIECAELIENTRVNR